MKLIYRNTALLLLSLLLLGACNQAPCRRVASVFDDVESYINEHPDSALAVLQGVDSTALTTRALRARYSLLRTMAEAKCYNDLTTPGLIDDAVIWYGRHGSADERMKTLYYQGCIAQANKDLNGAAVFFAKAEQLVGEVKDKHAVGLLYEAMASVYNSVFNRDKEYEYVEKAVAVFQQNKDPAYGSALGGLAIVYHSRKDWAKADSLYKIAIAESEAYPHAMTVLLSNYARMKVLQTEKDPEGAIELLNRKRELSGALTVKEAGAYAFAAELLGQHSTADALIKRLETMSGSDLVDARPWLSRIALVRGNIEAAYKYQTESHIQESTVLETVLSNTVEQALREDADRRAEKEHMTSQRIIYLSCLVCLALLSLALMSSLRKRKFEAERDRLIGVREQLQAELESSERKITNQQDRIIEMERRVALERETYTRERVNRLRQLGELRSTFWWRERWGMRETETLKRIKEEIAYVFQTDNDGVVLVRRLDKELDGAVSRLRKELNLRGRPREVLFLCCCILDLEPELIAEIMSTTKANVYEKRSRLRARIRELGDPLMSVLVEKSK